MRPQLVVLAGPNGAGKSTFYEAFLGESALPFLNADRFAVVTGVDSLEAARILDATRDRMIDDGIGFITETVFSDPHGAKLGMLRKAVAAGYDVTLVFICVADPEVSVLRVGQRVAGGGHDVPRDRIIARYARSLANLKKAVDVVPSVKLYDNSSLDEEYQLVATFHNGLVTYRAPGRLPAWTRGIVPPKARTPSKPKKATKRT